MAISVLEELHYEASDPVLGLYSVTHSLLLLERIFEILFHRDGVAIGVL